MFAVKLLRQMDVSTKRAAICYFLERDVRHDRLVKADENLIGLDERGDALELLRRSGKPQDGLVSRYLNRPISRAVTAQLLKYPITPSGWTLFILIFPIGGALLFLRGTYSAIVAGMILFQLYSALDGCDGEIARIKHLESESGRRLDSWCDIGSNILLAFALGLGLGGSFAAEGAIAGVLIALNEFVLAQNKTAPVKDASPIYPRHRAMWEKSGIGFLGDKVIWWLVQLTKRDVAILFFLFLALVGRPAWILHLLGATAAISLGLALKARRATNS